MLFLIVCLNVYVYVCVGGCTFINVGTLKRSPRARVTQSYGPFNVDNGKGTKILGKSIINSSLSHFSSAT